MCDYYWNHILDLITACFFNDQASEIHMQSFTIRQSLIDLCSRIRIKFLFFEIRLVTNIFNSWKQQGDHLLIVIDWSTERRLKGSTFQLLSTPMCRSSERWVESFRISSKKYEVKNHEEVLTLLYYRYIWTIQTFNFQLQRKCGTQLRWTFSANIAQIEKPSLLVNTVKAIPILAVGFFEIEKPLFFCAQF